MRVYICKYGYTYMYYILIASIFFIPPNSGKFLLNYSTPPSHKIVDILAFLICLLKKNAASKDLIEPRKVSFEGNNLLHLRLDSVQMLYI